MRGKSAERAASFGSRHRRERGHHGAADAVVARESGDEAGEGEQVAHTGARESGRRRRAARRHRCRTLLLPGRVGIRITRKFRVGFFGFLIIRVVKMIPNNSGT
jgi:hypothetical protein